MNHFDNIRLIDKLRTRKQHPLNISPQTAAHVMQNYLLPMLNQETTSYKRELMMPVSPRNKLADSKNRTVDSLREQLEQTYGILHNLRLTLRSVKEEQNSITKETKTNHEGLNKSEIIDKNLDFILNIKTFTPIEPEKDKDIDKINLIQKIDLLRSSVEKEHSVNGVNEANIIEEIDLFSSSVEKKNSVNSIDKINIIEENGLLRSSVEKEHSVNNIRLINFLKYFLNQSNYATSKENFIPILSLDSSIKEYYSWR